MVLVMVEKCVEDDMMMMVLTDGIMGTCTCSSSSSAFVGSDVIHHRLF